MRGLERRHVAGGLQHHMTGPGYAGSQLLLQGRGADVVEGPADDEGGYGDGAEVGP